MLKHEQKEEIKGPVYRYRNVWMEGDNNITGKWRINEIECKRFGNDDTEIERGILQPNGEVDTNTIERL